MLYFLKHNETSTQCQSTNWQPGAISEAKFGSHSLKTASNEKTAEILAHGKILTGQEVSRSHQVTETPEKGSIRDNNKKLGQIIYSELFTSFGGLKQRPDLRRRHLAG